MDLQTELKTLLDTLATERDELIVKAHLAKLEAQDEWQQLERNLEHLRAKSTQAAALTGDAAKDVWGAAKLLGEEIARGYQRLRRTL